MSLSSIIGQASRGADLYFVFRFLRLLTMKYESTDAYKFGIIDKKGKALRKSADLTSTKEKASYTMLHRMVFKIRRLMEKIPGGRFVNYAAALFLLKEQKDARIWTDDIYMKTKLMEFLETDWEANAKLLKEEVDNMDKKTFKSFLTENQDIDESQELQAMMALDDAGIEAVIDKKGKIVIDKKDKKKAEKALKKSFRKGGAPEIQFEEVEIEEAINLKKLRKEYDKNEDQNYHTENYLLLAKAFGTSAEVKKVEEILKRNKKQGSTSAKDSKWMYNNIMKYYDKIRAIKPFTKEEVELNEGGDQIWFKGIGMTFDEFSLIFATMYVPGSRVLPTEVAPDNSKYGSLLKKLSRKDQKWVVSLLKDYMKRGGVVHKDVVKNFVLKEEVELDEAETPMYPPTIKNLRMIVKDKQNQVFMFKVGKARVDLFTASAIVAVYDGLKNSEHKKKLEDMIKTKEGFLKTQSFAMKMVK